MPESLLRQREVARLLNCSNATVKRLRDRHELPFLWVGGAVRFERAAVAHYLARQRVGGTHDAK